MFITATTSNRNTAGAFTLPQLNGSLVGVAVSHTTAARVLIREKDGSGRVLWASSIGGAFPCPAIPFAGGLYLDLLAGTLDACVVSVV